MVTCFVVSMMRRDVHSDRQGGKCTSSVLYPDLPHSTIYGIVTLLASVLMFYPLSRVFGSTEPAYLLVITTAVVAGIITILGARIDQLTTRSLYSAFPDFELTANNIMLQQVVLSLVYAVVVWIILLVFEGIV